MAETNKVVIDIEASGSKSLNDASMSLKQLKAELKAAQSAALNGDGKAAKRVAELKDRMEDLRDTTKSLQGSGVERISSSFGLLGKGLKDFDFDTIKTGFKGLGAAMRAIPIFLLIEAVTYLVQNFDELSKGSGPLAVVLRVVGKALSFITDIIGKVIGDFTDAAGATSDLTRALDKQGEAIKANAEKTKEALSEQTAEFDRQIRVAKATGKATVGLEIAKQKAIIDTNLAVAKQIEAFVRAGGELDDEKRKLLTASLNAIKDAKVTELEIEKNDANKKAEVYKKYLEDKTKKENEARALKDKLDAEARAREIEEDAKAALYFKQQEENKALELERQAQAQADQLNASALLGESIRAKERLDKTAAHNEEIEQISSVMKIGEESIKATQNLSDLVFAIKFANLKKGSAEEEKAAKNQFKINKALQIANATINGAQSVLAITQTPDPTGGILTAFRIAAQIGLTASTIAKISATQFQSSGGSSSSAPTINAPTSSGGAAPTTQAPTTQAQPFTRLDESGNVTGKQPILKAYVVESEMTDRQKRVGRLEGQASFG